jgi:hypothetical protein
MPGHLTGQGAARQSANADGSHPARLHPDQQLAIILRVRAGRQWGARARVQHVVADLRRIECTGGDYLMQGAGVADRGDAKEPGPALTAQGLEGGDDFVQHDADGERLPSAIQRNRIVQLVEVDVITPEALQTGGHATGDRMGDVGLVTRPQAQFGAELNIRLEAAQHSAEIGLRLAVPVGGRRVEIGHARVQRPHHDLLLVGSTATHHQATDGAASQAERCDRHTRPTEHPRLHRPPFPACLAAIHRNGAQRSPLASIAHPPGCADGPQLASPVARTGDEADGGPVQSEECGR